MTSIAAMRQILNQKKTCLLFFAMEPTVAYLNDSDCNDFAENNGEWVINENVAFDYSLCLDDIFNFIKSSSLHMPLPTATMACMRIEDDDESVFIVLSSKKSQSPIAFGKVYPKTFTFIESEEEEPP